MQYRSPALALLTTTLSLSACADGSGGGGRRDTGGGGGGVDAYTSLGGDAGPLPDTGPRPDTGPVTPECEARAELIYVIDRDGGLARFDPRGPSFEDVGTIDCGTSAQPFSMSVDQDANAWVLFDDHVIRQVSTLDARCTSAAPYEPGSPYELFGMGFTADAGGESLFVAGGTFLEVMDTRGLSGTARFGRITPETRTLTTVSPDALGGWPELSGNSAGQLFGFFRSSEAFSRITPGRFVELDPTSGAALETHDLSAMGTGDVRAWAFAFWGARFYVFIQEQDAPSSDVWRFDPADGSVMRLLTDTGRGIVGAGVSICAPVELI
jgi:hypothetical protein